MVLFQNATFRHKLTTNSQKKRHYSKFIYFYIHSSMLHIKKFQFLITEKMPFLKTRFLSFLDLPKMNCLEVYSNGHSIWVSEIARLWNEQQNWIAVNWVCCIGQLYFYRTIFPTIPRLLELKNFINWGFSVIMLGLLACSIGC